MFFFFPVGVFSFRLLCLREDRGDLGPLFLCWLFERIGVCVLVLNFHQAGEIIDRHEEVIGDLYCCLINPFTVAAFQVFVKHSQIMRQRVLRVRLTKGLSEHGIKPLCLACVLQIFVSPVNFRLSRVP